MMSNLFTNLVCIRMRCLIRRLDDMPWGLVGLSVV